MRPTILYPAISDATKAAFPQTLAPLTDPGTAPSWIRPKCNVDIA
jgi:hypothetical protein